MLVLVGRSCTGKDTIQKILCDEFGMERVVTCTTRPPRDGEVDGVDYHFIDEGQFNFGVEYGKKYEDLGFAEWTEYHVASGETWYYGSRIADYKDSENKVIILNPDGLRYVREQDLPVFVVEVTSPDNAIYGRQMVRGDDPAEASRRFDQDKIDFADLSKYVDTCLMNWGEGGPDRCARAIYQIYRYWLEKQRGEKHVED